MITASIADCMSKEFARIHPDMPVVQAAGKLIEHAMLGGPVTDGEGLLLGWISEQECLQVSVQVAYYNQRVATVADMTRAVRPAARPTTTPQRATSCQRAVM